MYFGFVRIGRSKEAEWEKQRKRDYAEASLKNLLAYEAARLDEAVAKAKKEMAVAGTAQGEGKTKADATKKDEEEKTAPDMEKMLSLLYDEVTGGVGLNMSPLWKLLGRES
jgi:hypothetical protein